MLIARYRKLRLRALNRVFNSNACMDAQSDSCSVNAVKLTSISRSHTRPSTSVSTKDTDVLLATDSRVKGGSNEAFLGVTKLPAQV